MTMERPNYEDSVAGGDDAAADVTGSSLGYLTHSDPRFGSNVGRLQESDRGNTGMVFGTKHEGDDG